MQDTRNSFLHTKDGKIFAFKSFKRIIALPQHSNIKLFKSFVNNCYVVIEQKEVSIRVLLYDSFAEERDVICREFDLSFPRDAVSSGGSRDETICVEMVQGVSDDKFFNELLAYDLSEESIVDVLLLSIDNKLLWIKFQQSFKKKEVDGFSVETITCAKGTILGLHYFNGCLAIIDDLSILTIFYLCPATQIIRRKEMQLEGSVTCYRFYRQSFVYSNHEKIIFIDLKKPEAARFSFVDLKGISCFTIVDALNFAVAIDRNQMFYYIPMEHKMPAKIPTNDYEEIIDNDLEDLPIVTKYLEKKEEKLLELEKTIVEMQKLKLFLHHLAADKEFKAGEAIVTLHRTAPMTIPDDAIICKATDQKLVGGFIELALNFSKILIGMNFTLAFNRKSATGVITRTVNVKKSKESLTIFIPAESSDEEINEMSLDLNFSYDVKGQSKVIPCEIKINKISVQNQKIIFKDSLDECLDVIERIKIWELQKDCFITLLHRELWETFLFGNQLWGVCIFSIDHLSSSHDDLMPFAVYISESIWDSSG